MGNIRLLVLGMNRKWFTRRSTDFDDSVNTDLLEKHGIDAFVIGPGHGEVPRSFKEVLTIMGGPPDVIITSAVWKSQYWRKGDPRKRLVEKLIGATPLQFENFNRIWEEVMASESLFKIARIEHDFWLKKDSGSVVAQPQADYRIINPYASPSMLGDISRFWPNARVYFLPFSVKPEFIRDVNPPNKIWDVCVPGKGNLGHPLYPYRGPMRAIMTSSGFSYPPYSNSTGKRPTQWDFFNLMRASRMVVFSGTNWKVPIKKFSESLASGSLVLAHPGLKIYKDLGIVHGRHFIQCPIDEAESTVKRFLDKPRLREKVAAAGKKFFIENLSQDVVTERWFVPLVHEIHGESEVNIRGKL